MSHGWTTCKCGTHYHEAEHPSGLGGCPQCEKPVVGWATVKHVKALRELTRSNTPDGDVCIMGLKETVDLCKATKSWYEAERIVKERYLAEDEVDDKPTSYEMVWL